jgi:glycosyltransferase involved in cell wall biosynthesis
MLLGIIAARGDPKGALVGLLHVLTDEAASLAPESLKVSICGKGSKTAITKYAPSLGQRLHAYWFERRHDYLDYLSNCYVGVVPWGSSQSRRLGFPTKLLDYIAVGLPVIASKIGSWSDSIEDFGFGILSEPTPVEWADSFRKIVDDEPLRRSMSIKAWEAGLSEFSSDRAIAKLEQVYKQLL